MTGSRVQIGFAILLAISLSGPACRRDPEPDPTRPALTATTLGMVYLQEGRLPEAEEAFRKVIALIPRAASGYGNLAQAFLRGERYQDAEAEIRKAIERDSAKVEFRLLLARVYQRTGRPDAARRELLGRLGGQQDDPRVLYQLAWLASSPADSADYLRRTVEAAPASLAARLEFALHLTRQGAADSALVQWEELQKQWPEPPAEARAVFTEGLRLLRRGQTEAALAPLQRFRNIVELTPAYQSSLLTLAGIGGPIAGYPVLTFNPLLPAPGVAEAARVEIRFIDVAAEYGVVDGSAGPSPRALAAGDLDGDGQDDLFIGNRLWRSIAGRFSDVTEAAGIGPTAANEAAAVADHDDDGYLDLLVAGPEGTRLYRGTPEGALRQASLPGDLERERDVRAALWVDLDHDGDLDLFLLTGAGNRVYRNNLDGSFTEVAAAMGLSGGGGRSVAFADFDGNGRIDLVVGGDERVALYLNRGEQRFEEAAAASGLAGRSGTAAVAVGDYDNDGFPDLLAAGSGGPALFRNRGDGRFTTGPDLPGFRGFAVTAIAFLDVDNDGRLDLVTTGPGRGAMRLFRNDGRGRFLPQPDAMPANLAAAGTMVVTDFDQDGDEDLVLAEAGGPVRLLRNDGGNASPYVKVQLTALRTASGKNNSFGIGAKLELRAGDLYQSRVVTSRVTHFGLGSRSGADALRIEWPNGVPQVLSPGISAEVREAEVLKGSCAFLYAWNGTRFDLVSDVMWKSALGMPMGIMGSEATYGPPGASTEYVRIPGEALRPQGNRYTLQVTEELWETAYLDQVQLLVVDHPDSVDVFVNERFVPPGPTPLRLYQAARARPPRSATDGEGRDLLPLLLARDDRYVGGLTPTRYQGITEPHDLVLDLGDLAGLDSVFLFLNGWIYPSDASINVAVAQSSAIRVSAPSLEVRDARGEWQVAIPDLGFPAGKRKTVIADLTGRFPTADHRIRIRTTMQIYWDQAFVAGSSTGPVTVTRLEPVAADLHARGFSRTFRKGGPYGPQWFDYDDVSTDSPWRPITGRFTRYGDVLPLLRAPDDMYVVLAPGDEATVHFDATVAPDLPAGWRRDFLLYSDGWIKDSDLNTATGTVVAPLPFHAMRRYPYGAEASYPDGAEHRRYLHTYQTRTIGPGSR